MFFGGHWFTGAPQQLYPQCEYFASRGMVAMTADYRTGRKHKAKPFHSVADAKSAVRWIRSHADELGIDPDKIVAAGAEAGGHLAACTGIIDGLDQNKEDLTISSVPNALVLLGPVLDTSEEGFPIGYGTIKERWKQISPVHHVKPGAPPTIICHGTADTYAAYKYAEQFTELMKQAGNECKLVSYEDQKQAFFNHFLFRPFPTNQYYREVLRACDQFLISLGYLDGEPTL
jgi:acetyl esterase/lipase